MKTKAIKSLLGFGVAGVLLCACHQPKEPGQESGASAEVAGAPVAGENRAMQPSFAEGTMSLEGVEYTYEIRRHADGSLPGVSLEDGSIYTDNSIALRVSRADGTTVYEHTFGKKDFAAAVDAAFLEHGILEGLVFDRIEGNRFLFAASVCYPNTDLYMAARVYVTPSGRLSVEKEDAMNDAMGTDSVAMEF